MRRRGSAGARQLFCDLEINTRSQCQIHLNILLDVMQLCANVGELKVVIGLLPGFTCVGVRGYACVWEQQGEYVKLFCVAEITPDPYQLHRGA